MSIKKKAFSKNGCSECPIKQKRIKMITKLEKDVSLLTLFDIASPKATSQLESLRGYQRDCVLGRCSSHV